MDFPTHLQKIAEPPQPEIPIDIARAGRRLGRSPLWWRPCRLILGAEERGNQLATACHRPG